MWSGKDGREGGVQDQGVAKETQQTSPATSTPCASAKLTFQSLFVPPDVQIHRGQRKRNFPQRTGHLAGHVVCSKSIKCWGSGWSKRQQICPKVSVRRGTLILHVGKGGCSCKGKSLCTCSEVLFLYTILRNIYKALHPCCTLPVRGNLPLHGECLLGLVHIQQL